MLVHVGPKLASRWSIFHGVANASQGVHEGFASKAWAFADVHEGSASGVLTWAIFQGVAKACQDVHEGFAPKAWVFQDVHEGSASGVPTFDYSFGLFHPLCFRSLGSAFKVFFMNFQRSPEVLSSGGSFLLFLQERKNFFWNF